MARKYLRTDRNGTKYYSDYCTCDRCGGMGYYAMGTHNGQPVLSPLDGGICWKCGGAGKVETVIKEYTPEHRAKLEAAAEKRKAKKLAQAEAERAEREAAIAEKRAKEAAEQAAREAARLAEIERNRGQFMGEVGERVCLTVTLERRFSYEVSCYNAPWKRDTVTGYVFKTEEGNTLVWKTTGSLGEWDKQGNWNSPDDGDKITIKGTIKAHEEYNNVNQTILNRVKWIF